MVEYQGRGRRHLSLCGSRQHVTDSLSPGNSVNQVVMFRSTHLLWYFVSKGGFIFRFIDTLLSIKPAYLVCISQHAVNINNIRWVLCWNTTSTKTSAVFPSQPSCNISTVLCRAVSSMPPAQWRGVGIHQHTGKWEWGLNNRALSHCHSARYVGRHCLESALLVSGTKNKRRKEKKKKNLIPVHGTTEKTPLDS